MGFIATEYGELLKQWTDGEGGLEDELFLYDFFKEEDNYKADAPLVLTFTGGLIAFLKMEGLDPECFGQEIFNGASEAVRRGFDNFSNDHLDEQYQGGFWEIQNIFKRRPGRVPKLAKIQNDSESLKYLNGKTEEFWKEQNVLEDEIYWAFHFVPKWKNLFDTLSFRSPDYYCELLLEDTKEIARLVRRTVKSFEEDLMAYCTEKPRQGFEVKWMNRDEIYRFLYKHINRTEKEPVAYDEDLSLLQQVCLSNRQNGKYYRINDKFASIITFKKPPKFSIGNTFSRLQETCDFPFCVVQTFQSVHSGKKKKEVETRQPIAQALKGQSRISEEYDKEATEYLGALMVDSSKPFQWKFSAVVTGDDLNEFDDRRARLQSFLKGVFSAEPMEEGFQSRMLAELGTIPGNGFINVRENLVTSKNAADVSFLYRLRRGRETPHLFFGDRQGGVYGFDLFDPTLPNWNCACLGGPGSGKSVLMNLEILGILGYPSQVYVIDIGNSFATMFAYIKEENPENTAVMRVTGGDFAFNPLPMIAAIQEKDKQIQEGRYLEVLEDGTQIPCPLETAKLLFTGWIKVLIGQGRKLSPEGLNRLDRALQGKDGQGGFFLSYENVCRDWLKATQEGGLETEIEPPEPLSQLKKFLRQECPEFVDAVELWTRGEQKKFFDSGYDSLSKAKAVYFELTGLDKQEELVEPFIAALMGTIWQRVTNPYTINEKKIIIVDEAWAFLSNPAFAAIIELMLRMIRKFNGFVVLSTQTPNEIKKGEAIKYLNTMSHQFIYPGFFDREYFEEHLGMTPHQMELHKGMRQDDQIREVLHWDRNRYVRVLRPKLDPTRYWFVTTNADDKTHRTKFIRLSGGIVPGVERLVKACKNKMIMSPALRQRLIQEYLRENHLE